MTFRLPLDLPYVGKRPKPEPTSLVLGRSLMGFPALSFPDSFLGIMIDDCRFELSCRDLLGEQQVDLVV